MGGRLSGIFISKYLKPRTMVFSSLVGCLAAALLLVNVGGHSTIGVYVGTCVLGYFISWQFGGCYSWIAQKGDITGKVAPLFLVGCGTGSALFPPLTGYVFKYALVNYLVITLDNFSFYHDLKHYLLPN